MELLVAQGHFVVQVNWWVGNLGEVIGQDLGQVGEQRYMSEQEELKSHAGFEGETWDNVFRLKFCLTPEV